MLGTTSRQTSPTHYDVITSAVWSQLHVKLEIEGIYTFYWPNFTFCKHTNWFISIIPQDIVFSYLICFFNFTVANFTHRGIDNECFLVNADKHLHFKIITLANWSQMQVSLGVEGIYAICWLNLTKCYNRIFFPFTSLKGKSDNLNVWYYKQTNI